MDALENAISYKANAISLCADYVSVRAEGTFSRENTILYKANAIFDGWNDNWVGADDISSRENAISYKANTIGPPGSPKGRRQKAGV